MAARPTRQDVIDKIAVVFPDRDRAEVLAILERYGTEPHEQEPQRVQLAVLKLCDEDDDPDLERTVTFAKEDFRDILSWAEYPNRSARPAVSDPKVRKRLAERDTAQMEAWMNKRRDET